MNDHRIKKTVSVREINGEPRLDRWVTENSQNELGEALSRSRVLELIKTEKIKVNGKPTKASHRVRLEDQVEICLPHLTPSHLTAYDFPLDILFEDSDCIVINKPSGLVVHPAAGHQQDTLVNALLAKVQDLTIGISEKRPGIVHRLDKDTSGVLVVAKTDLAMKHLAEQFKSKTVKRHYHAIVFGNITPSSGIISNLLGRHPNQRKKFASVEKGKTAITHFQKLDFKKGLSLVRCRLETGRTHQIRVHLSERGHSIIGDPIYGTSKPIKSLSGTLKELIGDMHGIGLHAYELGFVHPRTGKELMFQSPWPKNLVSIVDEIGFKNV